MKDYSYIDVLVNYPLNKFFTYKSIFTTQIGSIVSIPFGNNNEIINGLVISNPYIPKKKFYTKKILSVENYDSIISARQLEFINWTSKYYLVSISKIFNSIFSKNILTIKTNTFQNSPKTYKQKHEINLIVEKSKDYLDNIYKEIKNDNIENQFLILTPNSYQTANTYLFLSKKIKNRCYIYDSKTSLKEKLLIWEKLLKNEKIIILGSKSAVFLPFQNLYKIFVLAEHSFLFKETDKVIRYNSRDCAIMLSKIHNCLINLISDSPSIESIYNVKKGRYNFLDKKNYLKSKVDLSKISVIKKVEKKNKNNLDDILSNDVFESIKLNYLHNKKTLIFTPFSKDITSINNSLKLINNNIKIFSLSQSTILSRKKLEDFLININEYDVLIGSYSVIDSFESFNYSLIALINPDKISNSTNYKANEIYFQLIYKLIRKVNIDGNKKLIAQLFNQNNKSFSEYIRREYKDITADEMRERKLFEYSPYKRLISIEIVNKTKKELEGIGKMIFKELSDKLNFCILTDVGITKNRNKIFYRIYIKLDRIRNLSINKENIYKAVNNLNNKKAYSSSQITIDIDP